MPAAAEDASGSAPERRGQRACDVERLTHRADFLAAASGARLPSASFVLQARNRPEGGPPRVGFTVSKKVGNAVERNRVKRRLREVVRRCAARPLPAGYDYVLVGRRTALGAPFAALVSELQVALEKLTRTGDTARPRRRHGRAAEARNSGNAR